jgi:dienelactone hydrolase
LKRSCDFDIVITRSVLRGDPFVRTKLLAAIAAAFLSSVPAYAEPPIEAYGEREDIWGMTMSPSGQRFAFFKRQTGMTLLVVFELGKGAIASANISSLQPRDIVFQGDNHIQIFASRATRQFGGFEHGGAFTFDVASGKASRFLDKERRFRFFFDNLGADFGSANQTGSKFYTGIFEGEKGDIPIYSLAIADVAAQTAEIVQKGGTATKDWLVSPAGEILAREDWSGTNNLYELATKKGGSWKTLVKERTELPPISLIGSMQDGSGLMIFQRIAGEGFSTLHKLDWTGTISDSMYALPDREIGNALLNDHREVQGVYYTGLTPKYYYFDPSLNSAIQEVSAKFPKDAVQIVSSSNDYARLIFEISGGATAPAYFIYDRASKSLSKLSPQYLRIKDEDIQPVTISEYKARDGLTIPTLVTRPKSAPSGKKMPLIVMPHGGPESHDTLGFDYFAQYFASRGYVFLQPQFRGSDGFGSKLRNAGRREWGRKMQDDITDGVNWLIASGEVDPNRVCIIGASYGGYSALAGGAFTPDLYKCVAAIAPVTDIDKMLDHEVLTTGRYSATLTYWQKLIGDYGDKAHLAAISPNKHAAAFKAPVLLLHGSDDTVVPFSQSTVMEAALKDAGKPVRLVKLSKEDHWLSDSQTRLQTLKELDAFITQHIGQ